MKRYHLFCLLLVALMTSLQSCHIGLKASADFVKTKESGNSAYSEGDRIDVNVGAFFEAAGSDFGFSKENFQSADQPKKDDPHFSLRGEIEYIGKGAKNSQGGATAKIHLNYIEVPLTLCYNYPISNGTIFGGLGPYLAYGIGGKIKGGGFSESSFGEDKGGYKRFDAGLSLVAGYKMSNPLAFSLSYDLGLANTAYTSTDIKSRNRSLSINLYYSFDDLLNLGKK